MAGQVDLRSLETIAERIRASTVPDAYPLSEIKVMLGNFNNKLQDYLEKAATTKQCGIFNLDQAYVAELEQIKLEGSVLRDYIMSKTESLMLGMKTGDYDVITVNSELMDMLSIDLDLLHKLHEFNNKKNGIGTAASEFTGQLYEQQKKVYLGHLRNLDRNLENGLGNLARLLFHDHDFDEAHSGYNLLIFVTNNFTGDRFVGDDKSLDGMTDALKRVQQKHREKFEIIKENFIISDLASVLEKKPEDTVSSAVSITNLIKAFPDKIIYSEVDSLELSVNDNCVAKAIKLVAKKGLKLAISREESERKQGLRLLANELINLKKMGYDHRKPTMQTMALVFGSAYGKVSDQEFADMLVEEINNVSSNVPMYQ